MNENIGIVKQLIKIIILKV